MVTHHPIYIKAPDAFVPASRSSLSSAAAVYLAAKIGVSVISMHTNLDRSRDARIVLANELGFEACASVERFDDPSHVGLGALCSCEGETVGSLADRAGRCFKSVPRVWGDAEKRVDRVALIGGSLGNFGEQAVFAGADAIITGECGYHIAQDLAVRGLAVVLLGHDRSEEPFCQVLRDACISCGISRDSVRIIPSPRQWWTVA